MQFAADNTETSSRRQNQWPLTFRFLAGAQTDRGSRHTDTRLTFCGGVADSFFTDISSIGRQHFEFYLVYCDGTISGLRYLDQHYPAGRQTLWPFTFHFFASGRTERGPRHTEARLTFCGGVVALFFTEHSSRARQYTGTYSAFCGGVFYNSHYTYRCFQFCTSICKRWIASYIRRILDSCGGTHTETAVIARLLCGQSSVDQGPDFTKIAGTVGPDSEIAYCSCYTVKYLTFCGGVPIGTAQHTGFYSAFCGGATSNFTQTNRSSLLLYLAIIQVAADHRLLISEAQTTGTTTDCWRTYNPGRTEQLLTFCGGVSFISQVFVPQPIQHTDLYTAFCGGAIIHLHNFTGSFLCFKFDTNWIDREYTADCETDTVHIQAFCGGASTQSRPCSTLCTAVFALSITEPQQHWFGHCFEQDQTAERLTLGSLQRLQPLNCYWNLSVTALIWTGTAFLLTLIYNINTIARLLLANEALEF